MEPDHIISIRRGLKWVIAASSFALAALLIVAAVLQSFGGVRAHILNTFVALLVGALLAFVHMGAIRKSPKWVVAGLVTIAISQVCYLLWVWTGWATEALLYRLWWISMVPAVASTHLLVLRAAAAGRDGLIEHGTKICVFGLGVLLIAVGLYGHFPPQLGPVHAWLLFLFAAATGVGSVVTWRRRSRLNAQPTETSRGARIAWLVVSHLFLLSVGL